MEKLDEPIIVEQTFNNSVETVWEAITELNKMKEWFFPNISAFEPKVGFETRFVVQVEDRIFPHLWKIKAVEFQKKIVYDWQYEGYPGKAIVYFELMSKNNRTYLKLTYDIVENFKSNIPEFKRESGVEGWNYFIKDSLKKYLDTLSK